ncbi:MAG: SAM-dependent methyltransferase [Micrococcales bacterium]|nr:MAG: SAM-dependent methyltransferase [Micrococcales bacterium]PIE27183.1 MAG: SAM-dependent methyltransferase [Micrococcales bacterium]
MTPVSLAPLLTEEGWALLESLPPYEESEALRLAGSLREQGHPAALVSAAMTQSKLRARAKAKFGPFASSMLFTAVGLEQATRLDVAARHAARYAAANVTLVADLGCGIGGDAMALAGLDIGVLAVDRDELATAVATLNLRHFPHVRVECSDAMDVDLSAVDGAWLDPSRRTKGGSRRHDPRRGSPSWSQVCSVAAHVPATGAKLAPGVPHELLPLDAETQWVSVDGDLVEAAVWWGPLARPGIRRAATVLRHGTGSELTWPDHEPPRTRVGPLGQYLIEPDDAVLRAGLVGPLGERLAATALDPGIAYLSLDRVTDAVTGCGLARVYRVLDVWPFSLKPLRTRLRELDIGSLTIKKRGTAVVPEQLRAQLRLRGTRHATIVLTRLGGRQHVILVSPVD